MLVPSRCPGHAKTHTAPVKPAITDSLEPVIIGEIPVDRARQGLLKRLAWLPAKVALDLSRIDGITPVVARSVLDEGHERFVGAPGLGWKAGVEQAANRPDKLEVCAFRPSPDTIGFPGGAAFNRKQERPGVIIDE